MSSAPASSTLQHLIALLDEAVAEPDCPKLCFKVKRALEDVIEGDQQFLPERFMQPVEGRYARRLVHRDPGGRYTVLAMVWDKDQGTPLHDHAHMWCVECVYRGRIQVTSYSLQCDENAELLKFRQEFEVFAGPAEAGALIPPFEYHTIENASEFPSVTLHVYGGEMTSCRAFLPVEGGYQPVVRELSYTP